MRSVTTVVLILVVAGLLGAQSLDVSSLDLSAAVIHQAGPTSFYIRSVGIGGELYSLSFAADPAGGWQLSEAVAESENVLPASAILEFATITALSDGLIEVDGVLMDGAVYQGRLRVAGETGLGLASDISAGSVDAVNTARAQGLQAILAAVEAAEQQDDEAAADAALQEALAQQRAELNAVIAGLRAEMDALEDDLEAVVAERNELARDIINVAAENASIRDQKVSLEEQLNTLQAENDRLETEIGGLTDEVDRLTDLVSAYRSAAEAAPATDAGGASAGALPSDYVSDAELQSIAAELQTQLQTIAQRLEEIDQLSEEVAALEEGLRSGIGSGIASPPRATDGAGTLRRPSTPSSAGEPTGEPEVTAEREDAGTPDSVGDTGIAAPPAPVVVEPEPRGLESSGVEGEQLAQLLVQINLLQEANRELREEKERLEQRILEEILGNGFVAMMAEQMDSTLLRGFRSARTDIGTWRFAGTSALQTDENEFFAKLALPVEQGEDPVLYSFQVRSLDPDWVGVGLHLYVSDVRRRDLYGMGRSLLIWLTRDPEVRRTDHTYVELYRSDDDVNMFRVMDAMIEEPIAEFLDVQVLYEPANNYITVAINGEDKVRYRTWFDIDEGVEIALRALGRAEFRNLTVRTVR